MFDPDTRVIDNPGEVQNYLANYQSKLEPVSGDNLGVLAVAVTPLEDGHDGVLQASSPSERDGATSPANLCHRTETCHDGHSDNWTSLSLSGNDESLMNAKNTSQQRRNSGDGITALDASVDRSTKGNELTGERYRGPFSPPRKRRSVRPRLILSIDSDSD